MSIGTLLGGLVGLSVVAVLIFLLTRRGPHREGPADPSGSPDPHKDDESDGQDA